MKLRVLDLRFRVRGLGLRACERSKMEVLLTRPQKILVLCNGSPKQEPLASGNPKPKTQKLKVLQGICGSRHLVHMSLGLKLEYGLKAPPKGF